MSPNPVEKFWLYTTTRSAFEVGVVAVAWAERSNSVFEGAFGAALMSVNGVICAVAEKAKPIAPQRVKSFFILTGLILEWEGKKSFNMQIHWAKKKSRNVAGLFPFKESE